MKFKDYKYERPDIKLFGDKFSSIISEFENSKSAGEQYEAILKINKLRRDFETMRSIASIRYTINTKDKFYNEEHEFFDEVNPLYSGFRYNIYKVLIESKFRKELEIITGTMLFSEAESFLKTFSPEVIDDMKIENRLASEYVKLIATAKIKFEGEERNISGMSLFLESENRELRKSAYEAKWKFFEDNEKEFDRIYDELVKVRNKIAIKLGYKNYVQLGYDLMGRTDYSPDEVAEFRDGVKEFIVPVTMEINRMRKKRIGLDKAFYYDAGYNFSNGNPKPKGSPEWIMEKAEKMYDELSEETGKFIHHMRDHELLDLYNRKDKAAGGYCSFISNYKSPFIFSNMNGTADDIKVLTHEAGHAFQGYESRNFEMLEYIHPTMEAAEIHSMSMEFITWPWMNLFFEEDTDKFLFLHLSRSLNFIPYGVTVDEFQHRVYENPDATPEERKALWREIEKKYLPDINYDENYFLEKGGFWFHQAHIFKKPFYYIDYCLAQICALQFWRKCNHDRNIAWEDYLNLCKAGGSKSFLELLDIAKLESPFDKKVVESIVKYSAEWIVSANKELDYNQIT
ncbi:MAG: M3 family oligoendopeptidase [bacterium]